MLWAKAVKQKNKTQSSPHLSLSPLMPILIQLLNKEVKDLDYYTFSIFTCNKSSLMNLKLEGNHKK